MEYVFEELSVEEITPIKLPPENLPAIPNVVFENISFDDIFFDANPTKPAITFSLSLYDNFEEVTASDIKPSFLP